MSGSMSDLEKDIEESRARLDRTIDRIQDRLSPVNLVDEMLGSARRTPLMAEVYDGALEAVRRNPLPVLLIAAGVGMLLRGMSGAASREPAPRRGRAVEGEPVLTPVPGTIHGRSYDPDRPGAGPTRDLEAETKV